MTSLLFGLYQFDPSQKTWVYVKGFQRMHSAQARAERIRGRPIAFWTIIGRQHGSDILELDQEFRIVREEKK